MDATSSKARHPENSHSLSSPSLPAKCSSELRSGPSPTILRVEGSTLFTYANVWEVREDFSGISKCSDTLREGDAYPDIITEAVNCYYSESSGLYYYLFDDIVRSGMAEHYTGKVVLCLDKGTVELHTICSQYEQYEDPESDPLVTYSDADGKNITKEAYEQAVANWAVGMTMSDFEMEWVQVSSGT